MTSHPGAPGLVGAGRHPGRAGPTAGDSRYVTFDPIAAGTRGALVRWTGTRRDATCLFSLRIDADYREPHGGFAPLRVTYVWEEDGIEKQHVHVATHPEERYTIDCGPHPRMTRLIVERADTRPDSERSARGPARS